MFSGLILRQYRLITTSLYKYVIYNHVNLNSAATGPEKTGHARPVYANIFIGPL